MINVRIVLLGSYGAVTFAECVRLILEITTYSMLVEIGCALGLVEWVGSLVVVHSLVVVEYLVIPRNVDSLCHF